MCTGEVETILDAVGILACKVVEHAILDVIMSADSYGGYMSAQEFSSIKG